jgi:hypothetical protein
MNNIFEIKDARIVIVLTGEYSLVHIRGVQIGDGMLVGIPTAEAHVQATHKGSLAIN